MSGHYENNRLESMEHLKRIFPDGVANELNWCLLSTSGVHGLYRTLNEIEQGDGDPSITVLVVMPRMVLMLWGHIDIEISDIPYLRKLVGSSLEYIQRSQKNNV